jgi:cyclopropane fatty-acyl-phospholipid synthase-like methyltransferase
MTDSAITKRSVPRRMSLLARLRQRFQGASRPKAEHVVAPVAASPVQAARPMGPPPEPRTVRQWLYGPGFLTPGGADYVLELVEPFHLDPSMTMLDMGCGLGGGARAISREFKTYVAGFERDPELAQRATEVSLAQGFARHNQLSAYNPETFELRSGFYDHALAREATYQVVQKERFLRVLNQAMKPMGQLILTDFVRDRDAGEKPELAVWEAMQDPKPQLWTAAQYTDCFKSLGFDLRIAKDVTADYRRMILVAWKNFLERDELRQLRQSQAAPVIDEVERSLRTVAALESGALKFFYFVALSSRRRGPSVS